MTEAGNENHADETVSADDEVRPEHDRDRHEDRADGPPEGEDPGGDRGRTEEEAEDAFIDEQELAVEIEAAIEGILFVSAEPVPVDRIESVFRKKDGPLVQAAIERLRDRYRVTEDEPHRGLILDEVAGGLRIVTRPDLHGHLRKYFEVSGSNRLSMAALETLATIGYRQPITLPEIQELRGKNSSGVIKTLLERRLIRISGRKDVVGKPFLYSTTRDFLLHFGLSKVEDLPPLEEFEETFGVDAGEEKPADDREEEVMQQLAIVEERESDEADQEELDEIEREREDGDPSEGAEGEPGEDEVQTEAVIEDELPPVTDDDSGGSRLGQEASGEEE